ncbi:MAG: hypothetical protein BGP25_05150 [Lysobacterales bacterium 63-13]|nr:MAG: hypothetical protein BGP25_05150 [Xanthomonadales bacterium 63-13]
MAIKVTPEQAECARYFVTGESLKINALAGTGKTTTLCYLAQKGSPRGGRMLYTSFGKAIVQEAKTRFPTDRVKVSTNHSLAFAHAGSAYGRAGRLAGRVTATDLIHRFGLMDHTFAPHADAKTGAFGVIETINRFCQSADKTITIRHAAPSARRRSSTAKAAGDYAMALTAHARIVWDQMMDLRSTMPITHDVYLKKWALTDPVLPYSTILLDEAQDTSELMLDVISRQQAQIVIVGDTYQQIYSWRGAINAMDSVATTHTAALCQSFRFGQAVADVANAVLANHLNVDARLRGLDSIPSRIEPVDTPRVVLARTNSVLIGELVQAVADRPGRYGVVGGVDDLIRLVQGAQTLMEGRRTPVPDLAEFAHWGEVVDAAKEEAYRHLSVLVSLVSEYGTVTLIRILESVRGNETDQATCKGLFSTAHKAKGCEFDSVKLADDFRYPPAQGSDEDTGWTPEDANLLYVAATRAKHVLDPTNCVAMRDAWGPRPWMPGT